MGRVNIGILIDEAVLKALDADVKKTAKNNDAKWSRSRQIEYELAVTRGLWKTVKPYLPKAGRPKTRRD